MLSGEPNITRHACERAFERLHLDGPSFRAWVRATYRDWIPINASYLSDRGVRVSAEERLHFLAAWTWRENVALCVSEDQSLITVMTFSADHDADRFGGKAPDQPRQPKRLSPLEIASKRIANELGPQAIVNLAIGRKPSKELDGALFWDAIDQFGNGRRDLNWLTTFWKSNSERRAEMLNWPDRNLTEAERQLIRPAVPAEQEGTG